MLGSEVAKVTCQKWRALIKFLCSLRYNKTDIDIQTHRQTEIYRYLCVHIYLYIYTRVCVYVYIYNTVVFYCPEITYLQIHFIREVLGHFY